MRRRFIQRKRNSRLIERSQHLKSYSEETRQQFGEVIRTIIESNVAQAVTTSQKQMGVWIKGSLDRSIRDAQEALASVTRDFRLRLLGPGVISCGVSLPRGFSVDLAFFSWVIGWESICETLRGILQVIATGTTPSQVYS